MLAVAAPKAVCSWKERVLCNNKVTTVNSPSGPSLGSGWPAADLGEFQESHRAQKRLSNSQG